MIGEEFQTNRYLPRPDWRQDAFNETYKSQMVLITEGLKLLGLANGGGAVAILTLVGSMAGRCKDIPNMIGPVSALAAGLFFCLVGFAASYFAQMSFLKYLNEPQDKTWELKHKISFSVGLSGIILSLLLFVLGAIWAAITYSSLRCS